MSSTSRFLRTKFLVVAAALAVGVSAVSPPVAHAGFRFRFHGRVGGSVHVAAPRVRYYPRPFLPWWPSYVVIPTYREEPPQPAPIAYPAGPSAVVPAAPSVPLARFGLGASLGSAAVRDNDGAVVSRRTETALALQARFAPHWLVELSLRQARAADSDVRRDYLGAGLVAELTPYADVSPYALGGFGRQVGQVSTSSQVESTATYAELGGGLRVKLGREFEIRADLRAGAIRNDDSADATAPVASGTAEQASRSVTRVQVGAMIRF